MALDPETIRAARALLRIEQAGVEVAPNDSRRRDALYDDLRAISLWSAGRLEVHEQLTDADLWDEDGLPA